MAARSGTLRKIITTLGSIKTGVTLLIIVTLVAAAGTVVLQRPLTEPEKMAQAYSPQTLRMLDAIGLTNVYHAWWFVALLMLVATSIVLASIERWPNAWRFYARPYRRPDSHFRSANKYRREFPLLHGEAGLSVAERVLQKFGFKPQRITDGGEVSLYAEKNRFSVFAVYIIHASLLMIFAGGIVDGIWGYKGYVTLVQGQTISEIELRDGGKKSLPFTLRCDGTGQENYPDGTPKRWWSKLAVSEDGKQVLAKEIVVNDPLVYRGIRFFQSGFGQSDKLESLALNAHSHGEATIVAAPISLTVAPGQPAAIDADTSVSLVQIIPDFFARDGQIYRRSNNFVNPAIELVVNAKGVEHKVWIFPNTGQEHNESPYHLEATGATFKNYTGLQVAHEPGQWLVWAGCILIAVGMIIAFYTIHQRFWVQVLDDGKGGLALWVGAAASKHREVFNQRFDDVTAAIAKELGQKQDEPAVAMATAGK